MIGLELLALVRQGGGLPRTPRPGDPSFVNVPWTAEADRPYIAIRQRWQPVTDAPGRFRDGNAWDLADRAISRWFAHRGDPLALYEATYAYRAKRFLRPHFENILTSPTAGRIATDFIRFESAPPSYEFVRMAYATTAGFATADPIPQLGRALLKRDPTDEIVLIAFVREAGSSVAPASDALLAFRLMKVVAQRRTDHPLFLIEAGISALSAYRSIGRAPGIELAEAYGRKYLRVANPPYKREWGEEFLAHVAKLRKTLAERKKKGLNENGPGE